MSATVEDLYLQSQRAAETSCRDRLLEAIYESDLRGAEQAACQLRDLLGHRAAGDDDLTIAAGWIEEERERDADRRAQNRLTSHKLILTGAPLVMATLLTGLLAAVMAWSL